jgi:hypothetical protein
MDFPGLRPAAEAPGIHLPVGAPVVAASAAEVQTQAMPPAVERTRVVGRPAAATPAPAAAAPAAPTSRRGLLVGASAVVAAGVGGAIWWSGRAPAPAMVAAPPAAPAPVSAPVPAAVAAAFDAVDVFRRIVAAQTPGWGLELSAPSTRLRMDRDKLVFTIRAAQDGHVYAFNHGSDGTLQQLYPNGVTPPPRVSKGRLLTLPQGALEFNVTGPAGPSHLLVIVSAWPRDMSAFAPKVEGGFASFPTGSVAAALEGANAGRLPLLAGQAQCPAGATCNDEFGAALLAIEVTG